MVPVEELKSSFPLTASVPSVDSFEASFQIIHWRERLGCSQLRASNEGLGGRALREQGEHPSCSCLLRLNNHIDKRRHTIRSLLIRHPQLKPIGPFF